MPLSVVKTAGTTTYGHPIVGTPGPLIQVVVDISGLTEAEVDADGMLKPGVLFTAAGILVASGLAYAINPEPIKIVDYVPTDALLAADTATIPVGMITSGVVNRDIVEDNLGRAMTAAEIAGCGTDSKFTLTNT